MSMTGSNTLVAKDDTPWHQACDQAISQGSVSSFMEVAEVLLERPNLNSTHLFRADIISDDSGRLQTFVEKERDHLNRNGLRSASSTEAFSADDVDEVNTDKILSADHHEYLLPQFDNFVLQRTVVRRLIPRKPQLDRPLEQSCYVFAPVRDEDHGRLVVYVPHCAKEKDMPWYHPKVKALAYRYQQLPLEGDGSSARLSIHYVPLDNSATSHNSDRLERTFKSLAHTLVRLMKLPSRSSPTDDPSSCPSSVNPEHQQLSSSSRRARSKHISASTTPSSSLSSLSPAALKDTILPQHLVQDTYSQLKQKYAADLIARWAESTEPSKHVFEDLSIAAYLIELWRVMYPSPLSSNTGVTATPFPGFVDIACGNGVLVHILLREGYKGYGYDARRRKTWEILGIDDHLEEKLCIPKPFLDALGLDENNALFDFDPEVAVESVGDDVARSASADLNVEAEVEAEVKTDEKLQNEKGKTIRNRGETIVTNGLLPPGTFIISNHADELVPWTPILAALSCPSRPLPFLAIPCCSHALSGARHRYTRKDIEIATDSSGSTTTTSGSESRNKTGDEAEQPQPQPQPRSETGDLKALRAERMDTAQRNADLVNGHNEKDPDDNQNGDPTDKNEAKTKTQPKTQPKAGTKPPNDSQYASLTRKVVALSRELDIATELTLLRIPSTRNIGIVGNRQISSSSSLSSSSSSSSSYSLPTASPVGQNNNNTSDPDPEREMKKKIEKLITRECTLTSTSTAASTISTSTSDGGEASCNVKENGSSGGNDVLQISARTWIGRARKTSLVGARGERGKVNLNSNLNSNSNSNRNPNRNSSSKVSGLKV